MQSRRTMTWAEKGGCREKACRKCQVVFKPATSGHVYCPGCGPVARRENHTRATNACRSKHRHHYRVKKAELDLRKYGLSLAEYNDLLEKQGGRCAICRRPESGGRGIVRKLAVDHCHRTGRTRALLCHRCNGALGMVGDDVDVLEAMIAYLEEHRG